MLRTTLLLLLSANVHAHSFYPANTPAVGARECLHAIALFEQYFHAECTGVEVLEFNDHNGEFLFFGPTDEALDIVEQYYANQHARYECDKY